MLSKLLVVSAVNAQFQTFEQNFGFEVQELPTTKTSLNLGFINDVHIEPSWDQLSKQIAAGTSKESLKAKRLVDCYYGYSKRPDVQKAIAESLKKAHDLYNGYLNKNMPASMCVTEWNNWRATQSKPLMDIVESLFLDMYKDNRYIMHELCNYKKKVFPKLDKSLQFTMECKTDLGFFTQDSPYALIEKVLKKASEHKFDALIMNGDFIGHDRSAFTVGEIRAKWPVQQKALTDVFTLARKYMKGIRILPTIGNNDVKLKNNVPETVQQAKEYYEYLYRTWFPDWNQDSPQWKTFSSGGYYKYQFPGTNTVFMGLNTMFFHEDNKFGDDPAKQMLLWLERELQSCSTCKFIIGQHVFPGQNYFIGKRQEFWNNRIDPVGRYLKILDTYADRIKLNTGAHIHRSQYRAAESTVYKNVAKIPLVVTQSITPCYMNNPGFTTLTVSNTAPEFFVPGTYKVYSFQLHLYIAGLAHSKDYWEWIMPSDELGIDLNNPKTLNDYFTRYNSFAEYGKFLGYEFGLDEFMRKGALMNFFNKFYARPENKGIPLGDFCMMKWYQKAGYDKCMAENKLAITK